MSIVYSHDPSYLQRDVYIGQGLPLDIVNKSMTVSVRLESTRSFAAFRIVTNVPVCHTPSALLALILVW